MEYEMEDKDNGFKVCFCTLPYMRDDACRWCSVGMLNIAVGNKLIEPTADSQEVLPLGDPVIFTNTRTTA